MQGIPWIVYLMVPLVLGLFLYQRRKMSTTLAANTDKTLGAVASRLGMRVSEGDPNINLLYFQQPSGDFKRTFRAEGQPYGRVTRLTIVDGQKTNEYIVAKKITQSFGCFLEVTLGLRVHAFELSLRTPQQYLVPNLEFAERPELQTVSTGDPMLDQMFVVRSVDPQLAARLVPALKLLSTQHMVHVAGDGDRVWMSFPRFGLASLSYSPEEFLLALEAVACGIEGRPAPAGPARPRPALQPRRRRGRLRGRGSRLRRRAPQGAPPPRPGRRGCRGASWHGRRGAGASSGRRHPPRLRRRPGAGGAPGLQLHLFGPQYAP